MNVVRSLWASVQGDPVFMQRLHGWLTLIWLGAALPICLWLSSSIPFLVFISVYAVVTGHWSSWQASRVETKQDQQEAERQEREGTLGTGNGQSSPIKKLEEK